MRISSNFVYCVFIGDFCIGTSTEGCDNLNTNLYCIEGKCTCPDYLTHHYADLRSGLSTWWDKDKNKCVSLKGGICHLITEENKSSPGIPCQSQHKCVPSSTNSGPMGKCGSSSNDASSTATVRISTILSFIIIGLGFGFFKN